MNIEKVSLGVIDNSSYAARLEMDEGRLGELMRSIGQVGLLQPIIVTEKLGKFTVVAGHRRYEATRRLGHNWIECQVLDAGESMNWQVTMDENLCRHDLSPIEEASMIQECMNEQDCGVDEVAKRMNRLTNWCLDRLDLLRWPPEVQQEVHAGNLSVAAAKPLSRIDDAIRRKELVDYASKHGATAATTSAWLQAHLAGVPVDRSYIEQQVEIDPSELQLQHMIGCMICQQPRLIQSTRHLPICNRCQPLILELSRTVQTEMQSSK